MAQGGTFRSGFASGFSASFFSPGTELGGDGTGGFTLRTTIAGIVGGTASELGGGKFANGAISGAFVHMFNAEGSIVKTFKSLASGLYRLGDFIGRVTGFRDYQEGSLVLGDYYKSQAINEVKGLWKFAGYASEHPKLAIEAYATYNDYRQEQLKIDTLIKGYSAMFIEGGGIPFVLSSGGNVLGQAHELNLYIEEHLPR